MTNELRASKKLRQMTRASNSLEPMLHHAGLILLHELSEKFQIKHSGVNFVNNN
jgi:hypothetical protein